MVAFAKLEAAPEPRSDTSKKIAWFLAGVLLVMVLAQLVGFEKFIPVIAQYELPGGEATATIIACIVVIVEVFALPFLLRMPLSRLMRIGSMICVVLATVDWLMLTLWAAITSAPISNVGLFGSYVTIPPGWSAVFVCAAIVVLAAWSLWGLWPFTSAGKKLKKD